MFLGFAHWCIVQFLVGSPSPDLMYPCQVLIKLLLPIKKKVKTELELLLHYLMPISERFILQHSLGIVSLPVI